MLNRLPLAGSLGSHCRSAENPVLRGHDGGDSSGSRARHAFSVAPALVLISLSRACLAPSGAAVDTVDRNDAPTASVAYTCQDLRCEFSGADSSDDGVIHSYNWDFGDGSTATGVEVRHTYGEVGRYRVTLSVKDDRGQTGREELFVNPTADAPSVWLYPGHDFQAAVNAHPAGTEFIVKPGVHRLQSVEPKAGNIFTGEDGAVMSGAVAVTEFFRESGLWVVANQTQENARYGPNVFGDEICEDDRKTCIFPEDLFFDDVPLEQVASREEVRPGKWFFDYERDRVYVADDPSGRRVEISVAPFAFRGEASHGLIVRGLVIEKYANAGQLPALGSYNSDDVTFQHNEVRLNHGIGIGIIVGDGGLIADNHVHAQGQLGVGSFGATGLVIERNEIAANNHAGYSVSWEAGGVKVTRSRGLIVRTNDVHHNVGPGLWTDLDCVETLYENNVVYDNTRPGIWHEVSYAAIIRNNTVTGNRVGIGVAHSADVEVHGNVVADNREGIIGLQQARGDGPFGPRQTNNLFVHDNLVTMMEGGTGLIQQVDDDSYFTSRNNRFENNTYILGAGSRYFYWNNALLTAEEWRAVGQDVTGSFSRR